MTSRGHTARVEKSATEMSNKVSLPLVNIGNPKNKADVTPNGTYGATSYEFRISQTETTVSDYVAFLNAAAKYTTDSNGNKLEYLENLYSAKEMGRDKQIQAQVIRTGDGKNGYTYTAGTGTEMQPMANISWLSAARFANWMHNGQPIQTGYTANPGTESGAYKFDSNNSFPIRDIGAKYWIPSEDEWYKAAYFQPSGSTGDGKYWYFPTKSDTQPFVGTAADYSASNSANYNSIVNPDKLNPAGSFSATSSYYGIRDMAGSLWEWTEGLVKDFKNENNSRIVRGGSWSLGFLNPLKSVRRDYTQDEVDDDTGFRLASSEPATVAKAEINQGSTGTTSAQAKIAHVYTATPFTATSAQNFIEMVNIGDANNKADTNGFGKVDYNYRIGKNEITVGQYVKFLNSVATNPNAPNYIQDLYRPEMADPGGKPDKPDEKTGKLIDRSLVNGSYQYIAAPGRENLPVAWVNWFGAARFANWMHNGASEQATTSTTETGAYNLNGQRTGIFYREPSAKFWIPTEDEWYKAAYYSPSKSTKRLRKIGGYWSYATQSDELPNDTLGDFLSGNAANYNDKRSNGDVLTDVGKYVKSSSYYGTYDQTGNVWEWNDAVVESTTSGTPDSRGMRGGSFSQGILAVASSTRRDYPSGYQAPSGYLFYSDDDGGFRLASAPLLGVQ